jgi:glycosyltransferase involved in cell wall biosynthesis
MKALHIIQRYATKGLTGSEIAIELLCRSLAKQPGIEVSVITSNAIRGEGFYDPRDPVLPDGTSTEGGVRLTRLKCNRFLAATYYLLNKSLPFLNAIAGGRLTMAAFGPQLIDLESAVISTKPDLIHASPLPVSHVLTSWQVARRHRIPLVITPTMHFDDPRFDQPILYQIMADAKAVIAHTQFEKNELIKRGIVAGKIDVIHSSFLSQSDFTLTDDASFRREHGLGSDPYILFIGSKSFDKGTLHLLEAWPAVLKVVPKAFLVIAGVPTTSWTEGKKGKAMDRVIELDYVTDDLKVMILSGCSLLTVPSHAESFGMILLEAWAKKKPVIGGSAGATRELVEEGVNGYTVEFGDTNDLAKKIFEVLSKPKLARTMGESGFKKASAFTEKEMVDKTLAVYEKVTK